jgi:hypothetical protein
MPAEVNTSDEHTHPSEAHKAGCPVCNPDKTVPQLNAAYVALTSKELPVDQTDIDIALETAQGIEDGGEPTAANCIRACARVAQATLGNTHETPVPLRVRLLKDIYDDGQDHHPPGYVGRKGDVVVIHSIQTAVVSHSGTGDGFVVHDGELELRDSKETPSHCACGTLLWFNSERDSGKCQKCAQKANDSQPKDAKPERREEFTIKFVG